MRKALMAGMMSLALAGCGTRGGGTIDVTLSTTFDGEVAARMLQPGTNTIRGSALLRQVGGGVVTCAGNIVTLMPMTAAASEWAGYQYGNRLAGYRPLAWGTAIYTNSDALRRAVRETRCDAQGNFRFEGVADGEFYVFTFITWMAGNSPQGGSPMRSVKVRGGQAAEVVLSGS